jgi:hypothetical protein
VTISIDPFDSTALIRFFAWIDLQPHISIGCGVAFCSRA